MKVQILLLSLITIAVCVKPNTQKLFDTQPKAFKRTPLDDYVLAPDPTYNYTLVNTIQSDVGAYTAYVFKLTSQKWLNDKLAAPSIWTHYLITCVPYEVLWETSFIYIDGGSNNNFNEKDPLSLWKSSPMVETVCLSSKSIGSHLLQIPNEPIEFMQNGIQTYEDQMIAFTWRHFINDTANNAGWLARLPMTKAVFKALDTVQDFVAKQLPNVRNVKNFVVAGASKRGWTTWTTAVVDAISDKRVIAIIPIVIPVLNIVPNMNHEWRAYGQWSFALDDYLHQGVMAYLNKPQFQDLANIVDPWSYNDRLTLPKYLICATGDEFFMPDSPNVFYQGLIGQNFLRMVPNAEHSLFNYAPDVVEAAETYYHMIISKQTRPKVSWTLEMANTTAASITVKTNDPDNVPVKVSMWYATTISDTMRDFRLLKCDDIEKCFQPVFWLWEDLQDLGNGTYKASRMPPEKGWTGFFIELEYVMLDSWNPLAAEHTLKITTEVNIVPDIMPFPGCGQHCQ